MTFPAASLASPAAGAGGDGPRPRHVAQDKVNIERLTNVQAKTWEITGDIAILLGFGNQIPIQGSAGIRVFLIDVMATTPELREDEDPATGVSTCSILGLGLRACITVAKGSLSGGLSLDQMAANSTYSASGKVLQSKVQIDKIGLLPATDLALRDLDGLNPFDITFLERLSSACTRIGQDIGSRCGEVDVYKVEELLLRPIKSYDYENGISTSFGLHSVRKGLSYYGAMTRLKNKVQKELVDRTAEYDYVRVCDPIVRTVYEALLGADLTKDPYTKPNAKQIQAADDIYVRCKPKPLKAK